MCTRLKQSLKMCERNDKNQAKFNQSQNCECRNLREPWIITRECQRKNRKNQSCCLATRRRWRHNLRSARKDSHCDVANSDIIFRDFSSNGLKRRALNSLLGGRRFFSGPRRLFVEIWGATACLSLLLGSARVGVDATNKSLKVFCCCKASFEFSKKILEERLILIRKVKKVCFVPLKNL